MESAMASGKRSLNARTQARNARGQFTSVKTEVSAAPKQIILVYSSSDSEGAPGPTEKVATSDAGERKLVASVATRTRAAAAGKKGASGAPPLTGKRGSASVNKTTKGATSASKKKQVPVKKAIAGGGASGSKQKKESASNTKAIAMGASGSKQKNKLVFVQEEFSDKEVSSYTWVTDNSCDNSGDNSCDCLYHHRPAHMDGLQWALKRATNEAKACVNASAATYSKEAKKDIDGIFQDLYDEIKAKYKPKK